jgi:hypothetical protein
MDGRRRRRGILAQSFLPFYTWNTHARPSAFRRNFFFLLVGRKKLKEGRVIGSLFFFVVGPGGVDQLSDFEFSFSFLY